MPACPGKTTRAVRGTSSAPTAICRSSSRSCGSLPGVQVLFAFLLTVPFTQRFEALSPLQQKLYFGTLLSTALTTALLVAPSANHRMLFRKRDKEYIVVIANRLTIAGLASMALSMCGVILLISDFMFDAVTPVVATCGAASVFVWLWFVRPIRRRHRLDDEPEPMQRTSSGS
jgi:hypothetical protein